MCLPTCLTNFTNFGGCCGTKEKSFDPNYIVTLYGEDQIPELVARTRQKPPCTKLELIARYSCHHIFDHALNGFCTRMTKEEVEAIRQEPTVKWVEEDIRVETCVETMPTGVAYIKSPQAQAEGYLGTGANVVVIDTGIDLTHPDLQGNINLTLSRTLVSNNPQGGQDNHGHGTH